MRLVATVSDSRGKFPRELQIKGRRIACIGLQLFDHALIHLVIRERRRGVDVVELPVRLFSRRNLACRYFSGVRGTMPDEFRKNWIRTNLIPNCLAVNGNVSTTSAMTVHADACTAATAARANNADSRQCVRVTFARCCGRSGSKPRARASASTIG